MKKLDELMHTLDQKVDRAIGPSYYRYFGKYFAMFSATLLTTILLLVIFKMYYTKPYFVASIIQADLVQLEKTLHKIDDHCSILRLQNSTEPINFLTIKQFSGSMVGGINLAHPARWHGPYLEQNPSIQKKFYALLKARDGYFIVPGNGVMLPNGVVINRDIVFNESTAIEPQLQPGGLLHYKGIKFAVKINFKIGDWERTSPSSKQIDSFNKTLEQFNQAIPFTESNPQKRILV